MDDGKRRGSVRRFFRRIKSFDGIELAARVVALGGDPNWVLNTRGVDKQIMIAVLDRAMEIHNIFQENQAGLIAHRMPRMM